MGMLRDGIHRYFRSINQEAALAALAHPTRLAAFRVIVRHGPQGLLAGESVDQSGPTQSTFSTLAVLAKTGLVRFDKQGRNQIQRAEIATFSALMVFLAKDCCEGRPELCGPLIAELTRC